MVGTPQFGGQSGNPGLTPNNAGVGSGSPPPGVQMIITNLQNLVQAVNALSTTLTTQYGSTTLYKVSVLPSSSIPGRAFVSDSTVVASGNFGVAVVGGGSYTVPVYYDNISWKIG